MMGEKKISLHSINKEKSLALHKPLFGICYVQIDETNIL